MTASRDLRLIRATVLVMTGLFGCTGTVTNDVAVAVRPPAIQVGTGKSANFSAVVTGTADTAVTWSIVEGAIGGTITTTGLYTASLTTGTYHIVAQSQADASKSGTATVTIVTTLPLPASAQECAAEPINTSGHTVYYACDCQPGADPYCLPGNDSNNGTSPTTPFQTYSKLHGKFSSLQAGDTVAFCQGGSFANDNDSWGNSNCTAASPCTIRDYADPRWTAAVPGQRPVLNSPAGKRGITMTGANQRGFRILNLKLLAAGPGADAWAGAGTGTGPTTDILLCNLEIDGYSRGTEFYRAAERVSIIGNRFLNNVCWGMYGAANGLVVKDNYFEGNGGANCGTSPINQTHSIYIGGWNTDPRYAGMPATNITVTGNKIKNSSIVNGVCQAVPLVSHGNFDGLLMENNEVDGRGPAGLQNGADTNAGCYGIMLSAGGYSYGCYFRNTTIRRNRLLYTGDEAISLSVCNGCVVEGNEIIAGANSNPISAIYMPFDYQRAGDDPTTNVVVRSNTVYYSTAYGPPAGTALTIRAEGTGYVVSSNAVRYDGTSTSGFDCFNIDSPGSRVAAMDHNSCYRPNASSSSWGQVGSTSYSRSSWTSSFGFDSSSQESNPLFTSLTEPWDFTPCLSGDPGCSGTSPLIGAADPANYSPTAISGSIWNADDPGKPRDASPDIGAYER